MTVYLTDNNSGSVLLVICQKKIAWPMILLCLHAASAENLHANSRFGFQKSSA